MAHKKELSKKLHGARSLAKRPSNPGIYHGDPQRHRHSEIITFKHTPSKLEKSFVDKTLLPPIDPTKPHTKNRGDARGREEKSERSVLEMRIDKMKVHVNNWENLNKIKEESNMLKSIIRREGIEIEMESDEDEYYLREHYKGNGVENEAKRMKDVGMREGGL